MAVDYQRRICSVDSSTAAADLSVWFWTVAPTIYSPHLRGPLNDTAEFYEKCTRRRKPVR